jgi:threonyl-tRNA synthetase
LPGTSRSRTEDLPVIEKKMREIIAAQQAVHQGSLEPRQGQAGVRDKGEAYKVELIEAIPDEQDLKIYKQGDWFDLCRGPHMASTGQIGTAFKLMKVAGAYWRGDSNNRC